MNNFKKLNENNQVLIKNAFGTFFLKGFGIVVSLMTMPAYIKYFHDQDVLGLWFTILSVLSWILTFDLGIGNGLRNYLVLALVNKNYKEARKYISSAYITIGIIVMILTLIGIFIFPFIEWNNIFKIDNNLINTKELNKAILIVFIGIMLQFILRLVIFILYAMQKSFLNNLFSLLNNIIMLLCVNLTPETNISTKLIILSIINVISSNLPLLLVTIYIFKKDLKGCAPTLKVYSIESSKKILNLGGIFFFIQIMYMLLTTTNEFLIIRLTDSKYVVDYQIYNRLFTLISILFTLILTPVWSIVTKAITEKNYIWIKKLYEYLKFFSIIAMLLEFIIIIFLQNIIDVWLGDNSIIIDKKYAIIFAIYGSIFIWNGILSSIANGMGKLKVQLICFGLAVILKIPLSTIMIKIFDSWIGIIVSNILILVPYACIQLIVLNNYLDKLEKGDKKCLKEKLY
ncbi:lipopolysaccharide biosynthesis protein [Cetobacterium sp. SF1]|uniref:lipopolysaccharide biosynthesis protein n=1 Tax=Cetobacterium sp. SF1 TaxID=3417654 RepID=UPI003CEDBD61